MPERFTSLPPAELCPYDVGRQVSVEPDTRAHRPMRGFDHAPIVSRDPTCLRYRWMQLTGGVRTVAPQASQVAVLAVAELYDVGSRAPNPSLTPGGFCELPGTPGRSDRADRGGRGETAPTEFRHKSDPAGNAGNDWPVV
jgi:hypothetical protein